MLLAVYSSKIYENRVRIMEITFHYHLVDITKYLPEDFNIVFCFLRTYFKNPSRLTLVLKCSAEENLALPLFAILSFARDIGGSQLLTLIPSLT